MINKYNELRQTFLNGVKELFPNSPDLQIEVTVDNISLGEMDDIWLAKKEHELFCSLKYLEVSVNDDETMTDNFKSELYK